MKYLYLYTNRTKIGLTLLLHLSVILKKHTHTA